MIAGALLQEWNLSQVGRQLARMAALVVAQKDRVGHRAYLQGDVAAGRAQAANDHFLAGKGLGVPVSVAVADGSLEAG